MQELASAATFTWFGMVLALSFLEAPLKFRAPGVTLPVGLGIGRLVFRALNGAEAVLAIIVLVAVTTASPPAGVTAALVVLLAILAVQLGVVRPRLSRRTDRVLAGQDARSLPRSQAHLVYIACESIKVIALLVLGGLLLAS